MAQSLASSLEDSDLDSYSQSRSQSVNQLTMQNCCLWNLLSKFCGTQKSQFALNALHATWALYAPNSECQPKGYTYKPAYMYMYVCVCNTRFAIKLQLIEKMNKMQIKRFPWKIQQNRLILPCALLCDFHKFKNVVYTDTKGTPFVYKQYGIIQFIWEL